MQVICSYCRKNIGEKEPYYDSNVSHGMCMESGESRMHMPVKLLRDSGEVSMIISTEKIGLLVRIVIEDARPSENFFS